jgi:Secretion system C-terminal sorting domain
MINLNYKIFASMKKLLLLFITVLFAFQTNAQIAPVLEGLPDYSTRNSVRMLLTDVNTAGTTYEVEYTGTNSVQTLSFPWVITGTGITLQSLSAKTLYSIRARVKNGLTFSPWSNVIYLRTLKDVPTATTIEITNNCPSFTGVKWTPLARGEDVTNYIIQKSYGGGFITVAEVPGTQTQIYDNEPIPGRSVRYKVISFTESGSYNSESPFFTTLPYSPPPAPVNLISDKSKKTDSQVTIRWGNPGYDSGCNANVPKDIYVMLRRAGETEYKVYNILPQGSTSIAITGLKQKEIISVQLFTLSPQTLYSDRVTIADTTYGKPFAPGPIVVVAFKDNVNNSSMGLSWKDNSNDEDYFEVEFSTDSVNFKPLGAIKENVNTFKHQPIEEGVKYYYRVRAGNYIFGRSEYSAITFGTAFAVSAKPNAPYSLSAVQAGGLKVTLKWRDDSNNEAGFILERSIDNLTSFAEIKKIDKNIVTYIDAEVSAGKTYNYRIRSTNSSGVSNNSNVASVDVKAASTGLLSDDLLNIYPNPSHDMVSLNLTSINTSKELEVKVYDQANNLMFSKKVNQRELNIDIKKYNEGLYTVLISNEEIQISKKFMKQ